MAAFWHKADITAALTNVRFWGKADIRPDTAQCPLMTQNEHTNTPTDFRFGPTNGSSLNRHFVRWYWLGTHQNAIRSIDATPVSSRLCRSNRVGTFSMHATDADAGGRIQGRHHAQ